MIMAITTSDWAIAGATLAMSAIFTVAFSRTVRRQTQRLRFQDYVAAVISRFGGAIIMASRTLYALGQLDVGNGPRRRAWNLVWRRRRPQTSSVSRLPKLC